jgi:hypothetical protein
MILPFSLPYAEKNNMKNCAAEGMARLQTLRDYVHHGYMRILGALAASILAFQATPTRAEPWEQIGQGAEGVKLGIDLGLIRERPAIPSRNFPTVHTWVEFANAAVRKDGVLYDRQLIAIDCEGERSAVLSVIAYDTNGKVVRRETNRDADYNYEHIPPNTLVATIMRKVCPTWQQAPIVRPNR